MRGTEEARGVTGDALPCFDGSECKSISLGGSLPRACRERKIIETRLGACVLGGLVSEKP